MCLNPRLIENKKYHPNKKNGGYVDYEKMLLPTFDKRVLAVPIGCGECMECRKQKAREWQVRLLEDVRHNTNGKFITLTFSNESIAELAKEVTIKQIKTKVVERQWVDKKGVLQTEYKGKKFTDKNGKIRQRYVYETTNEEIRLEGYETDNAIAKLAVRKWLERWRKKNNKSLRHWLITELGHNGTENVHLHGFVWSNENVKEIAKTWQYGYVYTGEKMDGRIENYVNERTVNYCTKYITKVDFDHKFYKPKILSSAGIGAGYMSRTDWKRNVYKGEETKEYYTTRTGHKMSLPIYWRNKIYTEEEREKLWLQKLDKYERWVGGEKVDVSETYEEYYKLLAWYQAKSHQLGYRSITKDWDEKKYEEDRRNMLINQRIVNGTEAPDWVTEKVGNYEGDDWLYN